MKLNSHISLLLVTICIKLSTQYYFAARTGYCTFSVSNQASNEEKSKKEGFYWRDYNDGKIPCDAFPAGKTKEHPVIYIGQVYIPKFGGLFPANIFPGKKTVLVNDNGTVEETSKNIQILCSEVPSRFVWNYVTTTSVPTIPASLIFLIGGQNSNSKNIFIARSAFEKDVYVGGLYLLNTGLEYTDAAGESHKSNKYELLLFDSKAESGKQGQEAKIAFAEDLKAPNYGNLVPSFYKKLQIGGLSATCTNRKPKSDPGYYWRQYRKDFPDDAVLAGVDSRNISYYIGQGSKKIGNESIYFPSQISSKKKYLILTDYPYGKKNILTYSSYSKILCSENTDTLHWIKTTTNDVKNTKKNWVIGGSLQNGTQIAIGRGAYDDYGPYPGKVALSDYPILSSADEITSFEGVKYELLSYKEPVSAKQGILKNIWSAFGVAIKIDFCL